MSVAILGVAGSPATLAIQPVAINAIVTDLPIGDRVARSITRVWNPGDTRRCRLCPSCTALHGHGVCTVATSDEVGDDPASILLFSLHGRVVVGEDRMALDR